MKRALLTFGIYGACALAGAALAGYGLLAAVGQLLDQANGLRTPTGPARPIT